MTIAAPVPAIAQQQTFQVNIPAQSLDGALRAFARASRQQILFEGTLVRGKRSAPLVGAFTVAGGLRALLAGTGLETRRTSRGAWIVSTTSGDESAAGAQVGDVSADIVVIGSNIRGVSNETAPVIRYSRADIEDSGYSTTQDLLESIPQIFGGGAAGASEDGMVGAGSARATNATAATGVNLRGLGTNSTLVLLNGRRMAPSQYGEAIDVSLLPLGAIGGVDVLTDGASALYGSDAVAGVVNIKLRKDFEGFETAVRFGGSTRSGRAEQTISQAFGRQWQDGSIFISGQYQDLGPLRSDQRDFTRNKPMPTDVLPDTQTWSGVAFLEQQLGPVEVFVQGFYASKDIRRDNREPNARQSTLADAENISLNFGGAFDLPGDWRVSASILYGRDSGRSVQEQVSVSTAALRKLWTRNTMESWGSELVLDGSLFDLPAGRVRAAFGASYRNQDFWQHASIDAVPSPSRSAGSNVRAIFGELHLPLVRPTMGVPALRRLEVSLAVRHDDYDTFGSTTNPRVGVLYEPLPSLRLRASYSTSFRAPTASEQFISAFSTSVLGYPFGSPAGLGTVPALYVSGSRGIGPETARSFTAGADWEPSFAAGLRFNVNYYDIAYRDRIIFPSFDTNALRQPLVYGDLIGTFANDAEAQAFIDNIVAQGGQFTDLNGGGATGVRHYYDGRQLNAAGVDQSGLDIVASYRTDLGAGTLNLRANASLIFKIDTQLITGARIADVVDLYGNPPDLRLRADAGWSTRRLSLNAALNHVGSYQDLTLATPRAVTAWTTLDLGARVRFGDVLGRSPEKLQLALSVQNVFDTAPPFIAAHLPTSVNYDSANASPLGRFVAAEMRLAW